MHAAEKGKIEVTDGKMEIDVNLKGTQGWQQNKM